MLCTFATSRQGEKTEKQKENLAYMGRKYRFDITPVSAIRTTQGDRVFFRIPRDKLKKEGLARLIRIERYNKYKVDLLALAKAQKFIPAEQGMHVIFHMPVPKSERKNKKERMHMMLHNVRPDWDNLAKGFFDSLLVEDNKIANVQITKKWVNQEVGYIEVIMGQPILSSRDTLA